jgi:hypothetical protein
VALPDDYWASFEHSVSSLSEFLEAVLVIASYQQATDSRFVWRGVGDASWALHSSLVRRLIAVNGVPPTETQLRVVEGRILAEAREWNLDWRTSGGRLGGLEMLASMQHFEIPTRLLDFTFNPLIALWFAVQANRASDGRVFAVDVANRLMSRSRTIRRDLWWLSQSGAADSEWATRSWIWRPPPVEERIVRQQGCFLTGGVPSTQPARSVRDGLGWRPLRAHEVRACVSVPLVLIGYERAAAAYAGHNIRGQPPRSAAFTLRVANRARIRTELVQTFGLSPQSLFPDLPGFAKFGRAFS